MIKNCFDTVRRLLFLLTLIQVPLSAAEDTATPITIGERISFPSEVLGETRELLVYKPPGYDYSDKRYHLLYLLDGNRHFHSAAGIVRFLTDNSRIPDVMVVAIPNNHNRIKRILYLSMGDEGKRMLGNAWRLSAALEEQAPESLQWQFELLASESHSSVVHKSFYQGLDAVYADWRIPNLAQLVESGSSDIVDAHFEHLSEKYGYRIPTPERIVNQLGYSLLRRQNPEAAIAAFKRNTRAFPKSANAFDSLGDGYRVAGQFRQAKTSYARALEVARAVSDPALEYYRSKLAMAERLLIKAAAE